MLKLIGSNYVIMVQVQVQVQVQLLKLELHDEEWCFLRFHFPHGNVL